MSEIINSYLINQYDSSTAKNLNVHDREKKIKLSNYYFSVYIKLHLKTIHTQHININIHSKDL